MKVFIIDDTFMMVSHIYHIRRHWNAVDFDDILVSQTVWDPKILYVQYICMCKYTYHACIIYVGVHILYTYVLTVKPL